jgi:hypothetical protein
MAIDNRRVRGRAAGSESEVRASPTYGIEALGILEPSSWSRFPGLDIKVRSRTDGSLTTTLIGRVPEGSALSGVILALCDQDLSLMAVSRLAGGEAGCQSRENP